MLVRFKEAMDQINFEDEFPIYSGMIKAKLKQYSKLAKLLDLGYTSLEVTLRQLFQFPDTIVKEIFAFLNEEDLEILISVFEMKKQS